MNLDLAPLCLDDVGGKPLQDPVDGESLPWSGLPIGQEGTDPTLHKMWSKYWSIFPPPKKRDKRYYARDLSPEVQGLYKAWPQHRRLCRWSRLCWRHNPLWTGVTWPCWQNIWFTNIQITLTLYWFTTTLVSFPDGILVQGREHLGWRQKLSPGSRWPPRDQVWDKKFKMSWFQGGLLLVEGANGVKWALENTEWSLKPWPNPNADDHLTFPISTFLERI